MGLKIQDRTGTQPGLKRLSRKRKNIFIYISWRERAEISARLAEPAEIRHVIFFIKCHEIWITQILPLKSFSNTWRDQFPYMATRCMIERANQNARNALPEI